MWSSLGDEPLPEHPRWVSEPNNRGTYSILSSCLLTLALCVWSCLHLNVPEHDDGRPHAPGYVHRVLKKTKWMFMGLLAPEVVAFFATCQWSAQRNLTADVLDALAWRNPPKRRSSWPTRVLHKLRLRKKEGKPTDHPLAPGTRLHDWTATHSFLALMGGFAFDNSRDPEGVPLPDGRQRLAIFPAGLTEMAQSAPELIPDVSLAAIADKSKTSAIVKLAACVQALWFCVQMIARMAQHLPLTMLELVTFAHALCAIYVYAVWWHKPLDVEEPLLIYLERGSKAAAICTKFCNNLEWTATQPRAARGADGTNGDDADVEAAQGRGQQGPVAATGSAPASPPLPDETEGVVGRTSTSSTGSSSSSEKSRTEALASPPPTRLRQDEPVVFVRYVSLMGSPWWPFIFEYWRTRVRSASHRVVGRQQSVRLIHSNSVGIYQDNITEGVCATTVGVLAIFNVLYNSWHITAWNGPFPNVTTQWLWRIAAVGPSGLTLSAILLNTVRSYVYPQFRACLFVAALGMLASRLFLIVESFIGLGYIPDGGFQQPNWSPYFPHIG